MKDIAVVVRTGKLMAIAALLKTDSYPEFRVFKNGQVVDSLVGANVGGLANLLNRASS